MNKDNEKDLYIRVGTTYYKIVNKPLSSGDKVSLLVQWNKETIISDHGKDFLSKIKKYTGFCCIPSHTNYQQIIPPIVDENEKIYGFYNEYYELNYKPMEGDITITIEFLKHIFKEQIDLALDFYSILYNNPTHLLPILCLVSYENNTGKTTYLNWNKAMWGKNMTVNTNDDFRSQFNWDWSNKLLIGVEEVLLEKVEDTEKIKNLSTSSTFKAEAKGKDRVEIEFFGKFLLCSNNELNFITIKPEETRFWVRKLNLFEGFLVEHLNNLLPLLISEIPAFLYFIKNRAMHTQKSSRMWFDPKLLETDALRRLKYSNRSKIEKEIISYAKLIMDSEGLDSVCFTPLDIKTLLHSQYSKSDLSGITRILKLKWGLKPAPNSNSYTRHTLYSDGTIEARSSKGKYYEITRAFLNKNIVDLDE